MIFFSFSSFSNANQCLLSMYWGTTSNSWVWDIASKRTCSLRHRFGYALASYCFRNGYEIVSIAGTKMYLCIYGEQNFGSHYFKVFFLHSSQHYKMGSSSYCNQITTLGTNWINLGTKCMQHFFLTSTPKILVWSMAINRGLSKNSKKTKNCLGS